MNLQSIKSRIIVAPQQAEDKTSFGLILPPSVQQKPSEAEILAVGPGTRKNPMTARVGEIVLYRPGAGEIFEWDGKKYLSLKEEAILATK